MYLSNVIPNAGHSHSCCGQQSVSFQQVADTQPVETIIAKTPLKPDALEKNTSSEASGKQVEQKKSILTGIEKSDFTNPKYGWGQKAGLGFIALYQKLTRKFDADGNLKSKHGLCCRFDPSCSQYTAQAIKQHGLIKGGLKGAYRMTFECNPVQPVTKEFGLYKGSKMAVKAVVSEVLGMVGLKNVFVQDREAVRQILQRVAEGEKTVAPVK